MIHNDVARPLADRHFAPRTLAPRRLTRSLACDGPQLPADLTPRALVRDLPLRTLPTRVLLRSAEGDRLPSGT
ncbi:hypothetical protein [Kitasatospora kifunensis]|uniref:Uncharacterized protein n=1 Tax=Kitasatospora kifunensis TaxID=58351 RepID=A0A7W7R4P4_KITKI|nr:hypothetical protein [Kitasatospora kifunensis]MBB4924806.1 hypothetical protein [Kitasatospora kifunensis]